jgi:hypothetical protein
MPSTPRPGYLTPIAPYKAGTSPEIGLVAEVLEALQQLAAQAETEGTWAVAAVVRAIERARDPESGPGLRPMPTWRRVNEGPIGSILKNLGFRQIPHHGKGRRYRYDPTVLQQARTACGLAAPRPESLTPAAPEPAPDPGGLTVPEYERTDAGFVRITRSRTGRVTRRRLSHFTAEIVAEVVEGDGPRSRLWLRIVASVTPFAITHGEISGDRAAVRRFAVPFAEFARMHWPAKHLGAKAIVYPGCRDHVRAAIQVCSRDPLPRRHVSR